MNNEDIKNIADFIKTKEENKQNKYESITKKALELFNKKQTDKFIDLYNNVYSSIRDKTEAIGTFQETIYWQIEHDDKNLLKFRDNLSRAKDKNFVFLYDNAMFNMGFISPEEFIKSIEEGIKKQIPMAYAIKSLLYYYGLEFFEPSKEAIQKAILLDPNNLEYKIILKELESETL